MTVSTLLARYSTWVTQEYPNLVNAPSGTLRTGYLAVSNVASKRCESILWFASPFDAAGGNVASATLRLVTRALPAGTHTLSVRLLDSWSQRFGSTHWANRPSALVGAATVSTSGALAAGTVWEFDVTSLLQQVASGQSLHGLLVTTEVGELVLVEASGASTPRLEVDWTLAPLAPSSLSPAGGRSVGLAKPVLRFNFADEAGETRMLGVRVQTKATSSGWSKSTGFSSPAYESGARLWTWAEFDLATPPPGAPAFTAPSVGSTVWWSVQVQDSAGLWSEWSQPTSWQYHPQPSVSFVVPTGATVSDPTPPMQFVYGSSGSPQQKWRASLSRLVGSKWVVVDHSGWVLGASDAWTPSRGMALTGTHRFRVDVWDSRDREATTGDPGYASADHVFSFAPGPVTGIYASSVTTRRFKPEAVLQWSRTEVPDEWAIYRDDELLGRFPGASLLDGGVFRFTDVRSPQGLHEWKVFAIVNGESSPSGVVSARSNLLGTWLVDPATGDRVCVVGDEDHGTVLPEVSATHEVLGARSSVVVVSAQRGQEGRVEGLVVSVEPGVSQAQGWRDRLVEWRPRTGMLLRLLHEGQDVPVNISGVTVSAHPRYAGEVWRVGFDFRQVAEFETTFL